MVGTATLSQHTTAARIAEDLDGLIIHSDIERGDSVLLYRRGLRSSISSLHKLTLSNLEPLFLFNRKPAQAPSIYRPDQVLSQNPRE